MAYEITRAVFDNFDAFRWLHPPSKVWPPPRAAALPSTRERHAIIARAGGSP